MNAFTRRRWWEAGCALFPFVIPVCRASGKTGTHKLRTGEAGLRCLFASLAASVFLGPGLGLWPNRDDKRRAACALP